MMRRVRVEVTQSCIERGERGDASQCPIALAVLDLDEDVLGFEIDHLEVDGTCIHIESFDKLEPIEFAPPPSVSSFVQTFDNGEPVAPFAFEIEVPCD